MAYPQTPDLSSLLPLLAGYDANVASAESGGDPNATNPLSSASGTYQMLAPTYQDTISRHPELAGASINDPRVMDAYTMDNAKVLQQNLNRTPSPTDLYTAHLLGATGASKFLSADPNSAVNSVVSPEAIASNKPIFLNNDGTPRTVQQAADIIAMRYGMGNADRSNPGGQVMLADAGNVATDALPDPAGTAGKPGATPAQAQPASLMSMMSLFPSPEKMFGPMEQNISDYIKSQPAVWQKLADMRQQYLQQAQPTELDRAGDTINGLSQGLAAANALKNATMGGVLLHALPNAQPFIQSLQNAHTMDWQDRMQRLEALKQAYQTGSQNLLGQMAQQGQNVTMQNGLGEQKINYAINTGKIGLELAKFGASQAQALATELKAQVPDPNTAAQVMQRFLAMGGNPSLPLNGNMARLQQAIKRVQAQPPPPVQTSLNVPGRMFEVTTFDQKTQAPVRMVVDVNTPWGAKLLADPPPGAKIQDLGAPQTNITQNSNMGGSGGGNKTSVADQHLSLLQGMQAASAAMKLLPYLAKNGGTGLITDSDEGKAVANVLYQTFGIDANKIPARELFGKLLAEVQAAQVLPMLKAFGGRTAVSEYNAMMKMVAQQDFTSPALGTYLNHFVKSSDYIATLLEDQEQARAEALQKNNPYFDNDLFRMRYQRTNPPPAWDTSAVMPPDQNAPQAGQTQAQPGQVQPAAPLTRQMVDTNGNPYTAFSFDGGKSWLRKAQ